MKKLLILVLAMLMTLSVFLVSGCGETTEQGETSNSVTTSSEEETSSSTRPSRNLGSRPDSQTRQGGVNPGISVITPTDSGDIGGGGNTNTSVSDVIVTGDTLVIPETPVGNASDNAAMVILTINFIESVSPDNFREKLDLIVSCETEYNKLTPSEKAEVVNYQHLVAARNKYNEFQGKAVLVEFENAVNALPEAANLKNADIISVENAEKMYNEYKSTLSSGLTNFATLEAKLKACRQRITEATVEVAYIAQDLNNDGMVDASELASKTTRTIADSVFGLTGTTKKATSGPATYSDKKNVNVSLTHFLEFASSSPITFKAPGGGTLTFYTGYNSRTYTFQIVGGDTLTSSTSGNILTFEIPSACDITITAKGGSGYLHAMKLSYPNLG